MLLLTLSLAASRRALLCGGALAATAQAWNARALEPTAADRLYAAVQERRPTDWREAERPQIDALIDELERLHAPWKQSELRGRWRLAYLQPGPDGAGVDRRIPFPELPWNNSYQVFGDQTVTNVGELAGPNLVVRVGGKLTEEDFTITTAPKRFRADITGGGLCVGGDVDTGGICAPLPITGVGVFDGVYLDERLRIGQNLNGGGARIVQVRVK